MTATPTFNYDLLQGHQQGTEEFGKARLAVALNFVQDCICWALEQHVHGLRKGKVPGGGGAVQ